MLGLKFLLLALFTVISAVKLSEYADAINNKSNVGGMLIGGVLLASVTALPEFVTTISSVKIGNPSLAIGNTFGSITFNILILAVMDFVYLRKRYFNYISPKYILILTLSIIMLSNITLAFAGNIDITLSHIGISSLVSVVGYFIYIYLISKVEIVEEADDEYNSLTMKQLMIRFAFVAVLIFIFSYNLTITADQIATTYPQVGSSVVGAFLLGVTTSLPEVVSVYTLLRLNSFNMAVSNILGSNVFNMLVLAVSDMVFEFNSIYSMATLEDLNLAQTSLFMNAVLLFLIIRIRSRNMLTYILPSLLIIGIYLSFWYLQVVA